jgi:hypothetical protein
MRGLTASHPSTCSPRYRARLAARTSLPFLRSADPGPSLARNFVKRRKSPEAQSTQAENVAGWPIHATGRPFSKLNFSAINGRMYANGRLFVLFASLKSPPSSPEGFRVGLCLQGRRPMGFPAALILHAGRRGSPAPR